MAPLPPHCKPLRGMPSSELAQAVPSIPILHRRWHNPHTTAYADHHHVIIREPFESPFLAWPKCSAVMNRTLLPPLPPSLSTRYIPPLPNPDYPLHPIYSFSSSLSSPLLSPLHLHPPRLLHSPHPFPVFSISSSSLSLSSFPTTTCCPFPPPSLLPPFPDMECRFGPGRSEPSVAGWPTPAHGPGLGYDPARRSWTMVDAVSL
jgi:hypothetical protein